MRYHEFLLEYDRAKAMAGFGGKLQARLQADARNKNLNLEQLFAKLEQADPSPNKQYVNWMARAYQNGSELEDLMSRGADNLAKLDQLKLKKQIKPEHSDVGKFKTLPELEAALDQYQIAKPEPEVDRGKYKEVADTTNARVIQWFDEKAAKYYGQGTKWCTAAERNNMASHYLKDNRLFVFIPKKPSRTGEKYQLAINKRSSKIQLMNEKDIKVNILSFRKKFPEVYDLPTANKYIGFMKNPTEEAALLAIHNGNAEALQFIKKPSEELQLAAVEENPIALKYIKNPSEELQLNAVDSYTGALAYIKNPTERVQLRAVSRYGSAISYIKEPTEKVQMIAIRENPLSIYYIKNASEKVQLAAVTINGEAIRYIKDPSEEMKLLAVNYNPWTIKFIKNQSEAVQLAAVSKNGSALSYITSPSEKVQLAAVNSDGCAIRFIKDPSEEMQVVATSRDVFSIEYIKKPTEAVQLAAIKKNWVAISKIADPTEAVQLAAIKLNKRAIHHIKKPTPAAMKAALPVKKEPSGKHW